MRLGTAIEKLVDNYKYASDKEWIQDKVAWALYHTWKEADGRKTEPTISKMEQVDKDINVRSKDEPQTRTDEDGRVWEYRNGNWWALGGHKPKNEPQTDRWSEEEHKAFYTFLWNTINPNEMQDYIEMFEGKSEPQTDCAWR